MRIEDIRRVLILGAGTVGQEVSLQCAMHGYEVLLYDIAAEKLDAASSRQSAILDDFVRDGRLTRDQADVTMARISRTTDHEKASHKVDLVSESVPERLKVKRNVFSQFHRLCPASAIFTTNSSYYVPSMLAAASGRPEQFAALHFHLPVWIANVVDIMPHPRTSPETIDILSQFARRIGQIPIVLRKENSGYVFNAMLWRFMMAALNLVVNEVVDVEDTDRAWMGVMGTPIGPFGIFDQIGLDTAQDVISSWSFVIRDPQTEKLVGCLQKLIDAGHLGIKTGQGFYKYPNPAYAQPGFLYGEKVVQNHGDHPLHDSHKGKDSVHPRTFSDVSTNAPSKMNRLVLRMVPSPLDTSIPSHPVFHGPVWILGSNTSATSLQNRLEREGAKVVQIPQFEEPQEATRWVERAWTDGPVPHLFLMTARDVQTIFSDGAKGTTRFNRGVLTPYYICQKWFALLAKANLLDKSSLIAATALGGDFGISSQVASVEGGAITGLLKAIFMEAAARNITGLRIKTVDAPWNEVDEFLADILCRELTPSGESALSDSQEDLYRRFAGIEIGYQQRCRHVLRVATENTTQAEPAITRGGTWVISGGARGITAFVAKQLGQKYDLKLHLLGRTPLAKVDYTKFSDDEIQQMKIVAMKEAYASGQKPNLARAEIEKAVEIQKNLQGLADIGVQATYHCCDVANRQTLAAVLDRVRNADGPIEGIIHGAGVEVTGRFENKTPETILATISPKVNGTEALMELTRRDPLRYFIAFGSLSGRFGGVGQTDYAMANDMTAKQVDWFRNQRPDCISLTFHWPGWAEMGMAARSASQTALKGIGHTFLAPSEGTSILLSELASGGPVGEVIIVDQAELPSEILYHPKPGLMSG